MLVVDPVDKLAPLTLTLQQTRVFEARQMEGQRGVGDTQHVPDSGDDGACLSGADQIPKNGQAGVVGQGGQ